MPYKKGPNGTLRAYSSSNGRYTKMSIDQILQQLCNTESKKKSGREKQRERIENLLSRARHSKDEGIYDLCLFIESNKPGTLKHVNENLYDKRLCDTREVDIVTSKAIIEVKSRTAKHALKQFLAQKQLSEDFGKKYYVYAPNISDARYNEYTKQGITVIRTKEQLLRGDL